jgi:hypothetical protein
LALGSRARVRASSGRKSQPVLPLRGGGTGGGWAGRVSQ